MPIRGACRQEMYNLESRLSQGHFSSRIWCLQSGRTKFRECVVCRACATCLPGGAKRRQTPNWCRKCDKALCVDKLSLVKQVTCFQLFHSVTRLETLVIETWNLFPQTSLLVKIFFSFKSLRNICLCENSFFTTSREKMPYFNNCNFCQQEQVSKKECYPSDMCRNAVFNYFGYCSFT